MIIPHTMAGGALLLWYVLTGLSLIFLIYDLETNTPAEWVMKLAWILIVLYTGPLGLFIYMLSCRQPLEGTHDRFIAPHWKQSVGSLIHCVAGDATGIIIGAIITFHIGLPNGIDLIFEYIMAFIVGLLIFQALFMKSMAGGNYIEAVKKTFFAETVSMNFVMVGMIPVMAILRMKVPGGDDPKGLMFWGISSLATIVGALAAYPVNSWLVGSGLKHGMMSAVSGRVTMEGMPGMEDGMQHKAPHVTFMTKLGVFLISAGFLLAAVWVTSRIVPLKLH
ncbi:MAG TPA: DUF4396 domain-containing protein [Thermodesulfobacteriota bacterium]|nr:DUF4396 domain-containing protein [Thermodesulfobacteriota bacterium]